MFTKSNTKERSSSEQKSVSLQNKTKGGGVEDNRPEAANLKQLKSKVDTANSENPVQLKDGSDSGGGGQANQGGLPDNLKSGVESLSGHSMDDVKVHYNSDKPAQLNAHAYAQGTDIHLASGQEKHLPHEAWHVAQQKQGRVKPTTQMKSKVPINDDPSLEKEADVMGAKAASFQLKDSPEVTQGRFEGNGTAQLKGFEDVEAFDKVQESREASFDPLSEEYQDNLKEHQDQGADMGEGSEITYEGELTLGARFNRWRGNESTYSQFMRKADEFNKSKDVLMKQNLLMELKPLARTWLEKHAINQDSGGKADENELKKQKSIYKFLNQTTSNYPQIINYYDSLEKDLIAFRSNPISNRTAFSSAVQKYKEVKMLKDDYKKRYPPSVNILYVSEVQEFAEREKALIKTDEVDVGDLDTKLGFTARQIKAGYDLSSGNLIFKGLLKLNYEGLLDSKGEVQILFDSEGGFEDIRVKKASAKAKVGEINVEVSDMNYEFAKNSFTAKKGTGKFKLLGTNLSLTLHNASYTKGVFDFDKLVGTADEVDTGLGIKLTNASVVYSRGHVILLQGVVAFSGPSVKGKLNGKVALDTTDEHKVRKVEIDEGTVEADVLGLNFKVTNIDYDSSIDKLKAEKASAETDLLGSKVSVEAENISYSGKEGFDVQKATGKIEGEFGGDSGIKIKDPSITFIKSHVILVRSKASLNAFGIDASGDVTFAFDTTAKHELVNVKIKDGELKTDFKNFNFSLEKLQYSLQKKRIKAKKAKAEGTILDTPVTLIGEDVSYGTTGFDFTKIAATSGGKEIKAMKVFSLKPEEFALLKKGEEYKAEAKGEIGLELPSFLDVKTTGKIKGGVGVNLDQLSKPYYNIEKASAKIEATNPLAELASYMGGSSSRYELSAGIPVFPGISAVFGLFVAYGADFGKKLVGEVSYEDNQLTIDVEHEGFKAFVEAGVFGGIQAGSELLLALALLLVASGEIELKGKVGYRKSYPVGEPPKGDKFKKGEQGITYKLGGAVHLKASLDIVATALYFFQKRFSIELGKTTLGRIEMEKGEDVKFHKRSKSDGLANEKELMDKVDPDVKEEAKEANILGLLSTDYTHRFSSEEKKDVIKSIKTKDRAKHTDFKSTSRDSDKKLLKFYDVAIGNMLSYNQFIDMRCNWLGIQEEFNNRSLVIATKTDEETVAGVRETTQKLGEYVSLASVFVDYYGELISNLEIYYGKVESDGTYKGGKYGTYQKAMVPYLKKAKEKQQLLEELNKFKQAHLHSKRKGDEKLQESTTDTSTLFSWMTSNYKSYAGDYNKLSGLVSSRVKVIGDIQKLDRDIQELLETEYAESKNSSVKSR